MIRFIFRICLVSVTLGIASSFMSYRAMGSDQPVSERQEPAASQQQSPDKDSGSQTPSEKVTAKPAATGAPASEQSLASALLGNLSPQHMKLLGNMLDEDWTDRPEWGEMAVAILKGDYMRPGVGWWKSGLKRYDWNWLREKFDGNGDGKIDRDEFPSDIAKSEQLFDRLDRDGDGQLSAADFDFSEPSSMNMAAMKNMMSNQLFSRLDKDSNGRITLEELSAFFANADKEELGFLTPDDLRLAIDDPPKKRTEQSDNAPRDEAGPYTPSSALRMFLRSELGWLSSGPRIDDAAPDFELANPEGISAVKLSDSFGKRPVVLIFGSFT